MLERLLELQPADAARRTESGPPDRLLPTNPAGIGTQRKAEGDPLSDNPAEHKAFRAHVAAEHTAPASVDALREWAKALPTKA